MGLKHDEGWTGPVDAPFYSPLPAIYRNVRFQFLFFYAAPAAIARYLPEPLEAGDDGECVVAGLEVPYSSYGSFQEAFVMLKARFHRETGYFCSHVFHNGPSGIAAGREIYGTPKIFADISVSFPDACMFTEIRLAGVPVLRLSTMAKVLAPPEAMKPLAPAWRLKLIPRADAPGPEVKQLIDCSTTTRDKIVHFSARGNGAVSFAPSPLIDLTPLQPLSTAEAFHLELSYSEHYATIVYDYLKGGRNYNAEAL